MFWLVDLEPKRYASEEAAREAAQAIASRECRPVIVCVGLPGLGYTEVSFVVSPE